jgi:hypothetical protein
VVSDVRGQPRIEKVALSSLGSGRYVVDGEDLLECQPPLFQQDVVEAEEIGEAGLRFVRVVRRADPAIVVLELGDHLWSTAVTQLGVGKYRLEAAQCQVEPALSYHDVVEAEDKGEGRLRYVRLVERSEPEMQVMTPRPELVDTVEVLSLLGWLSEQGGYWQRDWGNLLLLSVPKHAENDFDLKWKQVADAFERGLVEPGTALTMGRPHAFLVSLDAYREPAAKADAASSGVPEAAYLLFGKPHEGGPLWRLTGQPWQVDKKNPVALEAVSMPAGLMRGIDQWAEKGLKARQSGLPPGYSGFADEESERAYLAEGWNLCCELARVIHEPLEFWDFASGMFRGCAPGWNIERGELGKGEHCRMLARSADYALIGRRDSANLLRRGVEESVEDSLRVGAHDPAVTCGVIAPDQSWCATGGRGVIVYVLRPPWEEYDDNRVTAQWFELERGSTVTQMKALDRALIQLTISTYGEPIRDRLLDMTTRRLV